MFYRSIFVNEVSPLDYYFYHVNVTYQPRGPACVTQNSRISVDAITDAIFR
jgi:hypothetical protein